MLNSLTKTVIVVWVYKTQPLVGVVSAKRKSLSRTIMKGFSLTTSGSSSLSIRCKNAGKVFNYVSLCHDNFSFSLNILRCL